jgi:hypothetical protein
MIHAYMLSKSLIYTNYINMFRIYTANDPVRESRKVECSNIAESFLSNICSLKPSFGKLNVYKSKNIAI